MNITKASEYKDWIDVIAIGIIVFSITCSVAYIASGNSQYALCNVVILVLLLMMIKDIRRYRTSSAKPISKDDIPRELFALVDGAFEIVEMYDAVSPAQKKWKKIWLETARSFGASGE